MFGGLNKINLLETPISDFFEIVVRIKLIIKKVLKGVSASAFQYT